MLSVVHPILAALIIRNGLTFPYPFTNTTKTIDNADFSATSRTLTNITTPIEYHCEYVYPSDLSVVNARYPDYNRSHLHEAKQFFMLRREIADMGEIATRVQFASLPLAPSNKTCRLEFVLPRPDLQRISGFNPSFNVYQTERGTDSIATWQTYEGNSGAAPLFGQVNGEAEALERTRAAGGVAAINETRCNATLTFQMGMTYNARDTVPNYWEFVNVAPPGWPVQGFRIVHGC
ncbi:hypothetical protein FB567DRAFT_585396 [Paraphoma chrysanthemicola]|uniref:Ubiquitin 3 binding protein But2 C-terminal domain-containing protein n=1 Tax=Paraphoma chrysanthemicola TaxID=798071 RepID=A0A8K0QT55_9PLEO|nr:hypothetical protein FB567DRAFT_585396 [Paraphoma chrysanthemicola]